MRSLTELEQLNTEYLNEKGIQYVLVCLTQNILHHGIFDAKVDLRDLLSLKSIHDYDTQKPGERVFVSTRILTFKKSIDTKSSMYKAGRRGDARMWLGREIYKVAQPDDIFAIIPQNRFIDVLPISHLDLEYCCTTSLDNPIKSFFAENKRL